MKTSTLRLFTGTVVTAVGLMAAGTLSAADTKVSHKAADFIKESAQANLAEINCAQLAEQKAQNADVKELAKQMRENHQQANQKLQALAQTHNVKLETEPSFLQKRTYNKL